MPAATMLFLQDTRQIVVESRNRCEHPDEIAEADTTVEAGTKCAVCGEEID